MTASVSFAVSSPLLQSAPKVPRLYHAKATMDSPITRAQIDATRVEQATSTSLSFYFRRVKSMPEPTEQVDDVPPLSPENV